MHHDYYLICAAVSARATAVSADFLQEKRESLPVVSKACLHLWGYIWGCIEFIAGLMVL